MPSSYMQIILFPADAFCLWSFDDFMLDIELELELLQGITGILYITFQMDHPVTVLLKRRKRNGDICCPLVITLDRYVGINAAALLNLIKQKKARKINHLCYVLPDSLHYIMLHSRNGDKVFHASLHYCHDNDDQDDDDDDV